LRARATALCEAPQQLDALALAAWERAQTFAWGAKAEFYLDLYRRLAAAAVRT
jgi:hypothetical protein